MDEIKVVAGHHPNPVDGMQQQLTGPMSRAVFDNRDQSSLLATVSI
jgi:hypothetical protein